MKNSTFLLTPILVMAGCAASIAQQEVKPVMRDAATHEQLVATLRKAEQNDPMKKLPATQGEDPSVVNRSKDILAESDIISFRGVATLVPKRAVLQIPNSCTERMKLEPGARIISWAEFYAANRGWITTVEVSRPQAEGNQPLAEESTKMMTTSRNLVVATYQGGPISVLPPKQAAPSANASATNPPSKP